MLGKKENIRVNIRLYAGIHKELKIDDYDESTGIFIKTVSGSRLKDVLKTVGIKDRGRYIYFRNNLRISVWVKLANGDEISCLRLSGGG